MRVFLHKHYTQDLFTGGVITTNRFTRNFLDIDLKTETVTPDYRYYSQSVFNVGGFRVAQFVLMLRLPSHWPFIAAIALSASCEHKQTNDYTLKHGNDNGNNDSVCRTRERADFGCSKAADGSSSRPSNHSRTLRIVSGDSRGIRLMYSPFSHHRTPPV